VDELIKQIQSEEKLYANFRPTVIPNSCVMVKKTVPGEGTISVGVGQELKPDDIIAKFTHNAGFSMVNIAHQLGVSPDSGDSYLERPIGSTIYKGELLAKKKALFKEKIIITPTDCILEKYDKKTGDLRLKFLTKESPLVSGVYGIVVAVDVQNREILIKTLATQIFGIIGSGHERGGILTFVKKGGDFLVQSNQISEGYKGHILVTGSLIYPDALIKAVSLGVNGIISGGIEFDTIQKLITNMEAHSNEQLQMHQDSGISLAITEGFGAIPLSDPILETLQSYEGRYVFVSGNESQIHLPSLDPDSILTIRKTALPLNKTFNASRETEIREISIGAKARVIWPPFMGSCGKIVGIDKLVTTLESGISSYLVTIETSKRKFKVPFNNIELI